MSDPGQPTGSVVGDSPLAQRNPPAPTDPSAVPPTESDLDRRISERIEERLRVQRLELEEQRLQLEVQRLLDNQRHDEQRRQDNQRFEEQRRQHDEQRRQDRRELEVQRLQFEVQRLQLEDQRREHRREREERKILQLLNNLDRLFLILCPPATYGRASSVAPSITGKQSTKSSGSNNSKGGLAVTVNGTDDASRVLFTTTLLRSSEAKFSEDKLQSWFMTNAHILGKAEIKRCDAQAGMHGGRYGVLCARLHTLLGDIIKEVQSRDCRNIVKMVKGFELAMDAHKFTFVPDFDADSEYAWKVHVFDKEYRVDVTTVNSGNPTNRDDAEISRQRTTEGTVQLDDDPARTTTVRYIEPPKLVVYDLKRLDGESINFRNTVSIRCLLVRALSSFYVNHELTVEFLQRLAQWTEQWGEQDLGHAAAAASKHSNPKSSIQLIQEWLLCLHGDERSDGFKPALVASSHTEQSLLDEA